MNDDNDENDAFLSNDVVFSCFSGDFGIDYKTDPASHHKTDDNKGILDLYCEF